MALGESTIRGDGKSVDVQLQYTVAANRLAVIQGWVGFTNGAGESDDYISMSVDDREYRLDVGTANPTVGATLFVEVADLTGHYPDQTALSTSAGAGKVAFAKVTKGKNGVNNIVCVKMIGGGQLAS